MASALVTVLIILSWYGSNIGVLLLNKYLLSIFKFKYPVFLTLCHMVACSAMSLAAALGGAFPRQPIKSRKQAYKVSVLAVIFCVTVALGNVSLRYIPVSFNQAIGATTPAFTALLTVLVAHQRESRAVYLSLVPVVLGIVIASGAEPSFHLFGFVTAVSATAARAFKSVLQGMLLSDANEKLDSMNLLLYMAPVACLALVPMTLIFESQAVMAAAQLGATSSGFFALLVLNSCMAYFTNLTNFLVTKHTSALTLQVLGNAKGVLAVVVSILYFRNPVNTYSILGYAITVTGVVLYSQAKRNTRKELLLKQDFAGQELQSAGSKGALLDAAESGNGAATMLLKAFHKQAAGVNQRGGNGGGSPPVQIPAVGVRVLPSFLPAMQRSASVPVL